MEKMSQCEMSKSPARDSLGFFPESLVCTLKILEKEFSCFVKKVFILFVLNVDDYCQKPGKKKLALKRLSPHHGKDHLMATI